jgi:hypothetical protein
LDLWNVEARGLMGRVVYSSPISFPGFSCSSPFYAFPGPPPTPPFLLARRGKAGNIKTLVGKERRRSVNLSRRMGRRENLVRKRKANFITIKAGTALCGFTSRMTSQNN